MKTKKIISGITSAVMALTVSVTTLTACNEKECEHVYTWNVTTPATCTTAGSRDGVCGICGDVITEVIPIDPDAHNYGDWVVNPVPTEQTGGKAVKTCSYNQSHKLEVTLPVLNDKDYTIVSQTLPTALKSGEITYSYPHDEGNIQFTVEVEARDIQSVSDAVEVGVNNVSQIVKVAGRSSLDTTQYEYSRFYYEFGEDYTHIINMADGYEYYCLDDEEDFFAVYMEGVKYTFDANGYPLNKTAEGSQPVRHMSLPEDYINGVQFSLGYTLTPMYYGTEGLVSGLYGLARENANGDATEKITQNSDGTIDCEFSFGYYSASNLRLSIIKVEFSLNATQSISKLKLTSDVYGNMLDSEGNEVTETVEEDGVEYEVSVKAWEQIEGENRYIVKESQLGRPSAVCSIEIAQATETELGIKRSDLEENPYPRNFQYIKSFDISYAGKTVLDDGSVSISSRTQVTFPIINIENYGEGISNLALDPVTCYLRTASGELELNAFSKDDAKIKVTGFVNESNQVVILSMLTGKQTIVVRTKSGSFETEIKLDVAAQAPSTIIPAANLYNSKGVKDWRNPQAGEVVSVYSGQPLEFMATLTAAEASSCDPSFYAEIRTFNSKPLSDDVICSLNEPGGETMTFTATTPGTYVIRLISTLSSSAYGNLTVSVSEPPTSAELISGTYYVDLEYPTPGTATVEFKPANDTEGTVTITLNGVSETLSYTYTEGGIDAETQQRLPSFLNTTHKEGAEELGISLGVNEAYMIELTHSTGFDGSETAILYRR